MAGKTSDLRAVRNSLIFSGLMVQLTMREIMGRLLLAEWKYAGNKKETRRVPRRVRLRPAGVVITPHCDVRKG
jgi:hypothetical protein